MKAPSSSNLQAQFMQQYMLSQMQSNQQQANYSANLQAANQAAAAQVQQQQQALTSNVQAAASKPVTLGTLLTSPKGLLGNPTLSSTKLGG
ncbi:MAG: hypothetical protein KGI50_06055 [Patescibacteria group bacterium]|nr:hypothetical protein [Patescibacteria group bacterium]